MIDAITREEQYLAKAGGSAITVPKPITRRELFLAKLAGEDVVTPQPITREEMYLDKIEVLTNGDYKTGYEAGYAEGLAARTYETWTITLTDGSVIEKEVALL